MKIKRNKRFAIAVLLLVAAAGLSYASEEVNKPGAEYPAPSPNGSQLVYVSTALGSRDLWRIDSNGTNSSVLTPWPSSDEIHPDWSPNSNRIVFSSNRGSSKHQIWVINSDGTGATQLTTDDAEHEYPRFSPDGQTILYTSNETGKRELWLMSADGLSQRSIALISSRISDPDWSPNGLEIVYVGCRRNAECNLFRINRNGSNGTQITSGNFQDWNPDWGIGGILFASNRGNAQGLWLIQPDGSGLTQITAPNAVADLDPRWVGNTNAFVFGRSGKTPTDAASDIWSAQSLTGTPRQITKVGGPLFMIQSVLDAVVALRSSVTQSGDVQKINNAIDSLGKSVDTDLWIDSFRPKPDAGGRIINQSKDAMIKLRDLITDKHNNLDDAVLNNLMEQLVNASRIIAETAIADAELRGGDGAIIDKAREELNKGNNDVAAAKLVDAFEHYRISWNRAIGA